MEESIVLMEYQSNWADIYERERNLWLSCLGEKLIRIEHIGSTAIRTIKAKPIVDIIIEIDSLDVLKEKISSLHSMGYTYKGENGIQNRHFFQKIENGTRKVHVHIFGKDDVRILEHICFRDIMKNHDKLAKDYENLKTKLAFTYSEDRRSYSAGKEIFIKSIIELSNSANLFILMSFIMIL